MKKSLEKTPNQTSNLIGEEELNQRKRVKQQQKKSKESYLEYGFDDEEDLKEYEKFLR